MRSAVLFAALAVGSCARVIQKDVYVTEWTTVTVTETVTQWPTNAPSTAVLVKQDPSTKSADAPAPTVDLSKKGTVESGPAPSEPEAEAPAPSSAEPEPVPTTIATTSTLSAESVDTATSSSTAPSSTSSLVTSTSTAADSTATGASSYQESVLYNHNIHRSTHSADSLKWSDSLAEKAKTLAMRCDYKHDTSIGGETYGQNIGYGVSEDKVGKQVISKMMYEEEEPLFAQFYGQASPDMSDFTEWGHFTQIVWKSTKEVGCFTYTCDYLDTAKASNSPFTVCNYSPPGNYGGEYADNVLAPSS